ncbi:glycosyltransferase family 1 protein [Microbulbifer sp. THAF38]|uniref:glycosyltransferase family 4 protein n=1 Tax=Microbulbifer sp. THAF38 TaxID=2587856 RepID=UPI00126846A2|nr:glycosyltransferase family 1 protein [Microbulbifer sp. THAF38]QFT54616.1 D-inositol 3-phosphate glycosyltransferase [Microbulbifer sp. THAF38]
MAKIAVDARPLSIPTTGIGRYTLAVLERMLSSEHHWYLYSHQPLLVDFESLPNVTVRSANIQKGSLSTFFAQMVFPLWAWKDDVDLFWSPRHHLPLCLGRSISKVLTIHDLVWQRFPKTMSRLGLQLERLLMPQGVKLADSVIAVSEATANELRQSFPSCAEKIVTIYEAPFLEVSEVPGPPGEYFLFVGTIEPRKNLKRLLEAYSLYRERVTDPLPLKICGGKGWGMPELKGKVQELDLEESVEILGYITDDQLPKLYREARALLIPSLYEGFGLPIVEAYSQGTPVLTANRGAMAEVAGDAAVTVNPDSTAEIAHALAVLTQDLERVSELQFSALRRAGEFSWDKAAAETLSVIESALNRAR